MTLAEMLDRIAQYMTDMYVEGTSLRLNAGIWDLRYRRRRLADSTWYAVIESDNAVPLIGESSYGSPSISDALKWLVDEIVATRPQERPA